MVATIHNDLGKIEPLNIPIQIRNISTTLFVDLGSPLSFLNKSLAAQVVSSNAYEIWVREIHKSQLRTFSTEPIQSEEMIRTAVSNNS